MPETEPSGQPWSRDVTAAAREISPRFAIGLGQVFAVIETDGALGAGFKALMIAVAAANRGREGLMRAELARARALGVTERDTDGAAIALLLARGPAVFEDFVDAAADAPVPTGENARSARGPVEAGGEGPQEPDHVPDMEQALGYFRRHFGGEVPLRQRVFAELSPLAFDGYHLMHRAALAENSLSPADVELLMCAMNASDYQAAFLEIHIAGARAAGATEEQIAEAVLCAIPAGGIAVWPGAAQAIIGTRP